MLMVLIERFKIAIFAVKFTDFSLKIGSMRYLSARNAPILGFSSPNKLLHLRIALECKNNTKTSAVSEVWVSEVGQGLG